MSSQFVRLTPSALRRFVALSAAWALGLMPPALAAQTPDATLAGTVSDSASQEPINGARVFVPGTAMSATTRLDGTYRLRLGPGAHEIRVTYIGYGIGRDTVRAQPGEALTRDFQLGREPLALEELAVIGTRATERTSTEAPVPVDVLSAAEIKQT
ncbi:MAG: carboxypeptidase-like regulatory domain-containing protein, partial [Gemmatimonadales bacterium]|nr:carboxypeptidase-like regulatory domain-containing protein [Gemmatimonadales bacterium]